MDGHGHGASSPAVAVALLAPFAVAALTYAVAAAHESRRGRAWPLHRTVMWMLGLALPASAVFVVLTGAVSATVHAAMHVAVGMAAPVLLVWAAPVTLALRTLAVTPARRVSRVLRSALVRAVGHPVTAAVLSVGTLWLLHRTELLAVLTAHPLGHAALLLHFLAAGVLFTAAVAPVDPSPHRASLRTRAVVLAAAAAAHGILSKLVYVDAGGADERAGAQIMFSGGDAVDLALMLALCAQWYRAAGRTLSRRSPALRGTA
ncbi:cytochrome c oxidase assembly protein [Microbacterium sp. EYE_5]|uniref:cytochrome c oxidase assembly protein n=1 Tax=unclassified Microbacterium TaxID=2609290 RepID=UPI0020031EBD|nr:MULTISPECIES: cytochrome c oxidase assembly protein [unclassified Microbacterium]MCK6080218.1 cytochrome c oxidase assembly protein [Microbacterium sp. EYE_382]MCK6085489.1 cytochrome c oxidase assembly protein [Microbacterium sp. EYE_384]MCK6122286.1 cytochrome c oxidase assembly protein [Microbacterium sp. EYE_80]MCK6126252.1 cytochrome c oxidase assembly protein [Microbacterium sp. EYE_79]MCK6141173.1 cytochrome c oxidase assembly protein [Microbacterium sp. EYE_39]